MGKRKKRKRQSFLDFTVYTDGGCIDNPGGKGGFGAVLVNHKTGEIRTYSKGFISTTNNRMEMRAVIEGIKDVPKGSSCLVISDSQLVVNCLSGLWERKKNLDLWDKLDDAVKGLSIRTKWVKGHNGDILNEVCDALARNAICGELIPDEGYRGNKEKAPISHLVIPDLVHVRFLSYEPEIDTMFSNEVGRENIKAFKRKKDKVYKDYTSLKTGGPDGWSSVSLGFLIAHDGYGADAWNVIAKNLHEPVSRLSAMRWFRRGLSITEAINKAKVDYEVRLKWDKTL